MDQNDLFHNAPPSWAFTNKQKLKLLATFLWICRVQTKRQPTKTKDVQRYLTSPRHSLHQFCEFAGYKLKGDQPKQRIAKSWSPNPPAFVRSYISGIQKQQGRCGHKKEFECSSLLENPKSWMALFSFLGWGLFRLLFSVPSSLQLAYETMTHIVEWQKIITPAGHSSHFHRLC